MSRTAFPRNLLRSALLAVALFCFWQALAPLVRQSAVASPGGAPALSSERKLLTKPIQDLRPGMRVIAQNPEADPLELVPFEIREPLNWRLVTYLMPKPDGSTLTVEMLQEVVELEGRAVGSSAPLSFPELGIEGNATIQKIAACPTIEPAEFPEQRVITATFHHSAANVIDLQVESEPKPIGTTSNHPFWSEDRQTWVQAGDLEPTEHLRLVDGTLTQVTRLTPHTGPPVPVYNLTVEGTHTYHVGTSGVLVHNTYPLPILRAATHGGTSHNSAMVSNALSNLRRFGVTNVRTNQALSNGSRTLSKLRPDVQYIENGLIHIVEINRSGGPNYHLLREADMRAILGPLFGSYTGL